jgi:hypothetical protein
MVGLLVVVDEVGHSAVLFLRCRQILVAGGVRCVFLLPFTVQHGDPVHSKPNRSIIDARALEHFN